MVRPGVLGSVPAWTIGSFLKMTSAANYNPWHLLRYGDRDRAIALIREAYMREPTPSYIMELGIAYLWIRDYRSAAEHFTNAIGRFPQSMSSFYGMAGVAQWCLQEDGTAVDTWQTGLRAEYADAAGLGVKIPLLLLVASILKPDVFARKKAEVILRKKSNDPRASRWPGALTRLVLGEMSPQELPSPIAHVGNERVARQHKEWLVQFYQCILEFGSGAITSSQLAVSMRTATDTTAPQFSDDNYFVDAIWNEEFFIARQRGESEHAEGGVPFRA